VPKNLSPHLATILLYLDFSRSKKQCIKFSSSSYFAHEKSLLKESNKIAIVYGCLNCRIYKALIYQMTSLELCLLVFP